MIDVYVTAKPDDVVAAGSKSGSVLARGASEPESGQEQRGQAGVRLGKRALAPVDREEAMGPELGQRGPSLGRPEPAVFEAKHLSVPGRRRRKH